jgi:GNAT superfamily N-acetyltransferase
MTALSVRPAALQDLATVSDILSEAALWLEQRGIPLWAAGEVSSTAIRPDVEAGLYYLAVCGGLSAGVVRFQLEDQLFWPDVPQQGSAFIHRLAVRRRFSGGAVSTALLNWAIDHSRKLGKQYLRLDCAADRQQLRLFYERFGFRHHSNRQIGPYFVARYEYPL